MIKFINAKEAAALLQDGDVLAVSGFVGNAHPEALSVALEKRFLTESSPRDLTLVYCAGQGDGKDRGLNHMGHEGLLKRVIGGHWNLAPKVGKLAMENKIEAYNFPQGSISQWIRCVAGKRPGLISKVGLRTFVDPRVEGGKLNKKTTEDLVEVIELAGEEWLWYKPFPLTVAFIRGTTADEVGNISMEKEAAIVESLAIAQAVHNCGGKVIVQVERRAVKGSLHPQLVRIPGIIVDYVVVAEKPEEHMQSFVAQYNPAFSGETRIPLADIPPMKLDERKIICRRGEQELFPGAIVNLGIGMPEGIANVANERGRGDQFTLTLESGPVGGVPSSGLGFGASTNPYMITDQPAQFDFYDGGGIDLAFLGLAEADEVGNINVSKFKGRVAGCGGFINITQNAKKVFFCGTFTAGGLQVAVENEKLKIVQEGNCKKFLKRVEQITFSGDFAQETKQPVLYITERAVFELTKEGIVLIEIAPGIDLQTQILDQMEFVPIISPKLKEMDLEIFK